MERAALGVSVFLKGLITREKSNKCIKTVCVCGSGNNGADGLAVARQLNENGINVSVVIAGTSEGTEEYRLQKNIVSNLGIECVEYNGNIDFSEYDYIVDAMFGIGLSRNIEAKICTDCRSCQRSGEKRLCGCCCGYCIRN